MNQYYKISIKDISQFLAIKDMSHFVFRGQANTNWDLSTSLERFIKKFDPTIKNHFFFEKWMLDDFKKKIHLHTLNFKLPDNNFDWLSVMQHFGAPTRLLDFTYSFYVACYFALIDSNTDSSVWAINRYNLGKQIKNKFELPYTQGYVLKDEINRHHIELANKHIALNFQTKSAVISLDSEIITDRLLKQQGLFLMPTNEKESFMKNLGSIFNISNLEEVKSISIEEINQIISSKPSINETNIESIDKLQEILNADDPIDIIKFEIPKNSRNNILEQLRQMNITSEILFPGIDGLAKSLIQGYLY
jgi:hypothetical protein